ncbi:uncharacterized protein B0H18DRAFT_1077963, partial [Fomitopsis serialis]|uniref:uncharacterized protein n=1 Tax=Fomitopsis serialis TaxID=139415 RepID=UPI0020085174
MERRLARELEDRLNSRSDVMKSAVNTLKLRPEVRPYRLDFGDIARMPEVREIMCAVDSKDITARFAALPAQFGDMVERWKARVDKKLIRRLFMLYYPGVLWHECLHWETDWPNDERNVVYSNFIWHIVGPHGFHMDRLFTEDTSAQAHELIKLFGKDPKMATAKEMDALDLRLVRDNEAVMTWRAA